MLACVARGRTQSIALLHVHLQAAAYILGCGLRETLWLHSFRSEPCRQAFPRYRVVATESPLFFSAPRWRGRPTPRSRARRERAAAMSEVRRPPRQPEARPGTMRSLAPARQARRAREKVEKAHRRLARAQRGPLEDQTVQPRTARHYAKHVAEFYRWQPGAGICCPAQSSTSMHCFACGWECFGLKETQRALPTVGCAAWHTTCPRFEASCLEHGASTRLGAAARSQHKLRPLQSKQ